ncbi:MAG TPA: Type 1 glutamine amidotransferase-like domain-containing protein [Spirochaetia bacterium]
MSVSREKTRPAGSRPAPKTARAPLYLLAGGRGEIRKRGSDPLLAAAIATAGKSRPSVAYVGAASGDNAAFRVFIGRLLTAAGAGEIVPVPLCGRRASPAKAVEVLRTADIVFVSGGDVEEGMRVLGETGMEPVLREVKKGGTPFFGVSAGSIMLARSWVRWSDPGDDASAEVFPCLGFAPVLCDTHGEDDGWSELKALLALSPVGTTGYGIVSGTALVVQPGGDVEARGGEVHVFTKRARGVAQAASLFPSRKEE